MKSTGILALALLASASLASFALAAEKPASSPSTTQPALVRSGALLPDRSILGDTGFLALRQRAVLGLTGDANPALRFGATRFAAEGPWADVSFRRDDGRVVRVWLVDDAGPPPLLGDTRDPWDVRLHWSLSGPRKK